MPYRGRTTSRGGRGRGRQGSARGRGRGSSLSRTQHYSNDAGLQGPNVAELLQQLVSSVNSVTTPGDTRGGGGSRPSSYQSSRGRGMNRGPRRGGSNRQSSNSRRQSNTRDSRHQDARSNQQASRSPERQQARHTHFRSENPEFTSLIKRTNKGARLNHAMQNWDRRVPASIEKAIDKITGSIKPPLMDSKFQEHMHLAGANFKASLHRNVRDHLVAKYSQNCRDLAATDQTDWSEARIIVRKQIAKSNQRLTTEKTDKLILATVQDAQLVMQGRPHGVHHSAHSSQNNQNHQNWQQPRQTNRRSPPAATTPIELQNRFQVIADELTVDEAIDALEEPMSDPELIPPSRPKRSAPRRSPETGTPK